MIEPFDPSISSSDYLALARERHRARTSRLKEELAWMLDDETYDCGLNKEHVAILIDPPNWNAVVRDEDRKPRVFLHAQINQKGNAQISWARGELDILYDEDFLKRYVDAARAADSGPWRGLGELMWWRGYELLVGDVTRHKSPAATALLYAHAARLNDVASYLAKHVTLVGAMGLSFTYQDGEVNSADFVPTISHDQLQEMIKERGRRTTARLWEAVERMAKFDPE
ncbi:MULTISPECIES: hypothetical protein [unclassified Mesorhizobium]|uniref:hypothetical protein n=1 Tax=unclassified Mesorhizobium TaxID=325217 RepID=UPI0003CDED2B|nr:MULTISPECIES: hypothetical protein [unclassified Mesorhizobium]ESX32822.1 hypothetical protein X765_01580 [Mesorhizobium sp. LSHC440B00]ESX40109.1 hypothetical protein X763_06830 [Mesorhizobium sp. LSHC432A00]ESX45008.1 hypothetical protein X764_05885 [Mesorhizobium sp. LSHC440A00]WJI58907.1 hypothetical protein NLY33_09385 [Mesorhizobium sp. C432A]